MKISKFKKILAYFFLSLGILIGLGIVYFYLRTKIDPPIPADTTALSWQVAKVDTNFYTCKNNWLRKNEGGLWEMYVEGDAFERGVAIGKMAQHLLKKQEDAFINQIKKIVPSDNYLKFLKYFIAWFNRDLDVYIPEEYKLEIYGESFAAPDEYDFIGTKYHRMLNYHAAHDIGHALQDKNMVVGCSSFAVWGNRTTDSSMIIGRNFDFYSGDEFAEEKIVCFFNPDKGNKFMMVSWGGMLGAVSGMNEHGLTVTINAGKSDIPTGAATPISILAREILQYAKNIEEAYAIAKKRKTFVAEALMIGSATEGQTAIIEKSPSKIDIIYPEGDEIVCANHFQSKAFKTEKVNLQNIKESASFYRYQRMLELLKKNDKLDYKGVAAILRDQKGQKEKNIGWGNELAVNQLISHHSIIFKPEQKLVWVSSNPFQLGKFYAYDLNKIFSNNLKANNKDSGIFEDSLAIPADSFLTSSAYQSFLEYKSLRNKIINFIKDDKASDLSKGEIENFMNSNPEYYYVYYLLGDYYTKKKLIEKAKYFYSLGLSKEIPTLKERKYMEEQLKLLSEK